MLIRSAELLDHGPADIRIAGPRIAAIGALVPEAGEQVIDARGGVLLPGLHDHHIHLAALAARAASVVCGPPEVTSRSELAVALAAQPGSGWLRGVAYHESVMGLPDSRALDTLVSDRPLRIQHRSGRMWLLNSAALDDLLARAAPPPGMERGSDRCSGGFTGRLFDADDWLQRALASAPPDLAAVSAMLARFGVTGITDMSPRNDPAIAAHLAAQVASGAIQQDLVLAGGLSLARAQPRGWRLGPAKLHLHEADLPRFDEALGFVSAAHRADRAVAVHCVSEVELVFALALFEAAGIIAEDRIEHASIASPELIERIVALGLRVCVQPHFVFERGAQYRRDVEPRHQLDLYRLRSLARAGVVLVGGSDAPFGSADPWAAMRAAVRRLTREGEPFGVDEALSPRAALGLYLKEPLALSRERRIVVGAEADLCLLDRPWTAAQHRLEADDVRACWRSGRLIHDGIDQPPFARLARVQPPA